MFANELVCEVVPDQVVESVIKGEQVASCRLCGSPETDTFIPIFTGTGKLVGLASKIAQYLPIHVSEEDGLPQEVCYSCVDRLEIWENFYRICQDNDFKLRGPKEKLFANYPTQGSASIIQNSSQHETESLTLQDYDNTPADSDDEPLIKKCEATTIPELKLEQDALPFVKRKEKLGFSCDLCDRKFVTKVAIASHLKACANKKRLACEACGVKYKSSKFLKMHFDNEHNTSLSQCEVCKYYFLSKKIKKHMKSVHNLGCTTYKGSKNVQCKYCSEVFCNILARREHINSLHMQEEVQCDMCNFKGLRYVVIRHNKSRHCEKKYSCSKCPMAFKTGFLLKQHVRSHSDLRCYTCDICGKGFKRLNNVKEHVKSHQAKSLQCQICGNFFRRKRYLATHEKTIHKLYADGVVPENPSGFECTVCGAKLKWKKNIVAHMRIHTGEKPYWCKICNKAFICHGALRSHMNKHDIANASTLVTESQDGDPSAEEDRRNIKPFMEECAQLVSPR